jgi:ABC-type transporter Mla subunit MlaD
LNTAVEVVQGFLAQLPKLRDQGIRADQLKDIMDNVVEKTEKLRTTAEDNPGLQQALANSLRETSQTLVERATHGARVRKQKKPATSRRSW